MKSSEPSAAVLVQSVSLPGSRSFLTAVLREISFSARRRNRSSARSMTKSSSLLACIGLPDSQWSNGSLIACSTMLLRFGSRKPVLGLALEFRLAHEHREHHRSAHHHVFRGDAGGALALADALGVILQAAQHRAAHAGFMGAAVGRRHGVAVGGEEAVGVRGPRHRPFAGAMGAVAARLAGEDVRMHQGVGMNGGGEIILQAAGEVEGRLRRERPRCPSAVQASQFQRISTPPNR